MMKVVRYTKFPSNPYGDGGAKRSAQIEELWNDGENEFLEEKFILPKKYSFIAAIKWVFRAIGFVGKYVGWKHYPKIKQKINAVLSFALRIPVVYDKYKDKDVVFIWEHTNDYAPMCLMKAAGAKVIAYPHNLESLVPTQTDFMTGKKSPYWLYEEIERLKMCDEVYCISKEETWLLSLYGVNAFYFPYYPPKEAEKNFVKVKEARQVDIDRKNRKYLILGSATNPPTRMGMEKLVNELADKDMNYQIHVAGYGTESLGRIENSMIFYHGALNNEELFHLLAETDGLIINQPPTSGALTRIAEMRVAGIPVFVNFAAARDYYNLDGVVVYSSFGELKNLL